MIVKDLDTLGYHRVVFRCDNEPSIFALLQAVQLAWTGDVVQETSAEGDPPSDGAAENAVNVVQGMSDRSSWRWSQFREWRGHAKKCVERYCELGN